MLKVFLKTALKSTIRRRARLRKELQEKEDIILECKQENTALSCENILLTENQTGNWEEEKEKLLGAAYEEGFRGYVLGFLATDPDYSWEKFDPDTRKWNGRL